MGEERPTRSRGNGSKRGTRSWSWWQRRGGHWNGPGMLMGKAGPAWRRPGEHPNPTRALSSFAKSLLLLFPPQDAARCRWLCSKIKGGVEDQPQSKIPLPFPFPSSQAGATMSLSSMDVSSGTNPQPLLLQVQGPWGCFRWEVDFQWEGALPASTGLWVKWYRPREVVRRCVCWIAP